jgi:hypothetical protein
VTEQSGTSGKRDVKGSGVRASGRPSGKPSGTVVAIEQGSFVWHFEMQDPSERQQWIGAIKTVVLGQRWVLTFLLVCSRLHVPDTPFPCPFSHPLHGSGPVLPDPCAQVSR